MFVLSRVVVGLAKKSSYKRQADSCKTEAFFVLGNPYWTHRYKPSIREKRVPARFLGVADGLIAGKPAPT
ncbi:hypothetical protein, partial [Pseudomonas sp. GXM4]|uniref:hypothetical protein n=1 Tax=Pseudomonas sp. GXM4 TaxID=2651867 RepID=UPI001C49822F